MTRRRRIAAVAALLVAAVAVFAWLEWPGDETTRTSVADAVSSFRHEADGNGGLPGEPPLGVYRYATRGAESADTPLLDGTHDFGGVSTIVISPGRCGERERWQVLAERWTETESCPAPRGDRLVAVRDYHEFFGFEQEEAFRCRGGSATDPGPARAGASFTSSCRSDESAVTSVTRLLGIERIAVAGATFAALHTVTESRVEGASSGSFRLEDWRRRSDGLLLRRSAQSDAKLDTAGGTHHTEAYTLRLLDPQPRS